MGYITLAVLALTAIALLFGALFGMMRGRNRAILRLVLVTVCAILALVLRGAVVDAVMGIKIGGKTIKDTLVGVFNSGDMAFPASLQNMVFALVEIIVSLVAYFILLYALRFVSWVILFPILKIFVKKEENKKRGIGALIGLGQGIIVAFFALAPLTGLIGQVDKISEVKLGGKQLLKLPAKVGVSEYMDSAPGKVYSATGGWLFEIITSTKDGDGNKISIDDTIDVVVTMANVADSLSGISDSMSLMSSDTATAQDRINAIKDVGAKFEEIGASIDSLSGDAKKMVNDLLGDLGTMFGEEGEENPLGNLSLDTINLGAAGSAMNGIATYIEKTSDEFETTEPVTDEDVNKIVSGLAGNMALFGGMEGDNGASAIIEVQEEDKARFESAVEATTLSSEDKETLRQLLGLVEPEPEPEPAPEPIE